MAVFRHTVNVDTGASPANLRELEERSERLERSLRSVESRAGRVGTASTKLAGALGRVSPALGDSAMVVNDFADGLEVASMAGPRLLAVLGPIGAAVGVLAGAYLILNSRLTEANEKMKQSAEEAARASELYAELEQTANRAAVARGEMTAEELVSITAIQASKDVFAERRKELEADLALAERRAAAASRDFANESQTIARNAQRAIDEQAHNRIVADGVRLLEQRSAAVKDSNDALSRARQQIDQLNDAQAKYVSDLEVINNRTSDASSGFDNIADAASEATEAIDKTADSVDRLGELLNNVDAALGPGRNEQLQAGLDDLQRRIEARQRAIGLRPDEAAGPQQLIEGVNIAAIQGGISRGFGALSSPGSALGALGPAGAVIGGLAAIGQAGGAAGVEDKLDELLDNVTDGIEALPDILVNVIPPFVQALVTDLPPAIGAALVGVFSELIDSLFPNREANERNREVARDIFAVGASTIFGPVGVGIAGANLVRNTIDRREAASRGRMARADGARRMAMSRAPTAQIMGSPSLTINALGIDDGTQDQFQRRFARYTDPNTGLRGRDG